MLERILEKLDEPVPFRFLVLRWLDRRIDFLNYRRKLNYGVLERPHFGHCLLQAAMLARKLGHDRISAIEFGVAGGNGLLALERHAEIVRRETGVDTAIFGFDTGTGMPPPQDHRDLPYMWQEGYFAMDVERLRSRLTRAEVILGPVADTVRSFCAERNPPPIGFVSFDLDYYSSTVDALRLFDQDHRFFLPRVACYFDDIVGDIDWGYGPFTGELLAIGEFNERSGRRKLAQVNGLRHFGGRLPRVWHEQIFLAHLFDHPDYRRPISELTQHPLQERAAAPRMTSARRAPRPRAA